MDGFAIAPAMTLCPLEERNNGPIQAAGYIETQWRQKTDPPLPVSDEFSMICVAITGEKIGVLFSVRLGDVAEHREGRRNYAQVRKTEWPKKWCLALPFIG